MPKSVITARGPPPRAPLRARAPVPAPKPGAGAEVELLDEAARRRLQHHEGLPRVRGDLGRAARAGQARRGRCVGTDHGAVEVAEAVDLRGAEEADVDASGLQVIANTSGSGTTQAAVSASSPSPIDSGSTSGRVPIVPDS